MAQETTGNQGTGTESIRLELLTLANKIERASTVRLVIGIIVCAVLIGWFHFYAYRQLKDFAQPNEVVNVFDGMLSQNLPDARMALGEQIKKSAPQWARDSVDYVKANIPTWRAELEKTIAETTVDLTAGFSTEIDKGFAQLIRSNKKWLNEAVASMSTPDDQKAFRKELTKRIEASIGKELKDSSAQLVSTLKESRALMEDLREGKKLTEDERVMRELIMYCKYIVEQVPPIELPASQK